MSLPSIPEILRGLSTSWVAGLYWPATWPFLLFHSCGLYATGSPDGGWWAIGDEPLDRTVAEDSADAGEKVE